MWNEVWKYEDMGMEMRLVLTTANVGGTGQKSEDVG